MNQVNRKLSAKRRYLVAGFLILLIALYFFWLSYRNLQGPKGGPNAQFFQIIGSILLVVLGCPPLFAAILSTVQAFGRANNWFYSTAFWLGLCIYALSIVIVSPFLFAIVVESFWIYYAPSEIPVGIVALLIFFSLVAGFYLYIRFLRKPLENSGADSKEDGTNGSKGK